MVRISEKAMCMSEYNRKNQLLCWYTGEINICTRSADVADKIKASCKRRNIVCGSVWTRELIVGRAYSYLDFCYTPYNICKISIPMSLEADNGVVQRYCYVPASKKKRLADWAITTFNVFEEQIFPRNSDSYCVWIQPSSDVELFRGCSLEEEDDVETQWVKDFS